MRLDRVVAAALVLLLAACGGEGEGGAPGVPVERLSARFETLSDVVVVRAINRLALLSAALVSPDGERVPAYSLDVASSPTVSSSPAEEELLNTPGMQRTTTRIGTMTSTALIRLPDPDQYAKTWEGWRVALEIGNPGGVPQQILLAAPKPPG